MEFTEAKNNATNDLVELVTGSLGGHGGVERAVHPATAIASIARLSGSLLLRTFPFNLEKVEPGTAILSEEANTKGPVLMNIFLAMLQNYGIKVDDKTMSNTAKPV